jgi:UDP-GlcNAc:undecaprenyl-phosphate GlcNAc-1-phosphate transferase
MSLEGNGVAAFVVAALVTLLATPVAISVAARTSFFDLPVAYKRHERRTPYLGGAAILVGVIAGSLAAGVVRRYDLTLACAAAIWLVGTVDDRVRLPIAARLLPEIAIALLLWSAGDGWTVFGDAPADLAATVLWTVGLINAFNLMDNMDGAAATAAAVSALGAAALALLAGNDPLAYLSLAVTGAAVAFLRFNLARPARIFMGDGGSLQLGLLIACVTMAAVSRSYLGPSGVVVGALLVGLVILDTTLVTVSRGRAGRALLAGGRDHLTHRLAHRLGSPRKVALALALTQFVVCALTIAVARAGVGWVLLAGGVGIVLGAALIWEFESPGWLAPERSPIVGAEEQLKGQQRPQRVSVVARAGAMLGEHPIDLGAVQQPAQAGPGAEHRLGVGGEVLPEPAVQRDPEPVLRAGEDLLGE